MADKEKFSVGIMNPSGGKPLIFDFDTSEEREAFVKGIQTAIGLMGGESELSAIEKTSPENPVSNHKRKLH